MRHRFPVVVIVVGFSLAWIHPVFAFANMINNGSFETPVLSRSLQYKTILPGAEPTGFSWRVSSGNVDITVNGAFGVFASFDGLQFLDLDGTVPGAIAQSFATTPGNAYVLNFVYANNFGNGGTIPARGTVRVLDTSSGTNLIAPLSLTHSSSAAGDARWTPSGAIRFVAQGASTTLSFTSNDAGGSGGLFLDAVSVEPVTQPADRIVLSEDFEDGSVDSRISVQTTGAFSSGPGIKSVNNFGSTKAFGFGLSTCGASCFFSFATTLRITFPVP